MTVYQMDHWLTKWSLFFASSWHLLRKLIQSVEEIRKIPVEELASTNPNISSLMQPSDWFEILLFLLDWQFFYVTNLFFFLLTAAITKYWITHLAN